MPFEIRVSAGKIVRHDIEYVYNVHGIGLKLFSSDVTDYKSFRVAYVVLSNDLYFSLNDNVYPHNSNNLPTKNEFISNYTATFNVKYDKTTNELIENNNYYYYNVNDFNDNNTVINNTYIIEETKVVEDDGKENMETKLNYTGLLQDITNAIKALPTQLYDKFKDLITSNSGSSDVPEVEEGKSWFESLFDILSTLVSGFLDFITSIPDLILSLLDGLLNLVEKIVGLFIPSAEQLDELKQSFNSVTDDFKMKFSPVTDVAESIKSVYSSPKSIYDLTYTFNDQTINIVPESFRVAISNIRNVFSGALVVGTFIDIYKRFVGREDVIKW